MKNVVAIILVIIVSVLLFQIGSYAGTIETSLFIPPSTINSSLQTVGGRIIRVVQVIASMVSIGMLSYMGIKFMLGSISERADIKGHSVPYIVGAVMCFALIPILQVIYEVVGKFQ